jgi:hypothetical protein
MLYYFAKDGSYGDAEDILLTDAPNFTEDEWDIVAQTPDAERHNVVAQLLRETSGQDALPFDDGQDS